MYIQNRRNSSNFKSYISLQIYNGLKPVSPTLQILNVVPYNKTDIDAHET